MTVWGFTWEAFLEEDTLLYWNRDMWLGRAGQGCLQTFAMMGSRRGAW